MPKEKVGVSFGITVIFTVTGIPQVPLAGVKVYVPLVVLSTTAGLQVPARPLFEIPGKVGGVVPAQKGGTDENVGIKIGLERITPVFRLVVHPFTNRLKLA